MFSVKLFCSALACALAAQSALAKTCPGHGTPSTWSYRKQEAWLGQSCRTGLRQSPVDIRWNTVHIDWDASVVKAPLNFDNYGDFHVAAENDGHTVHVTSVNNTPTFGLLSGGPLGNRRYKFSNFHVHWFSEHTFDGDRFPLELHIVHHRADLTAEEALNEPDGYAVIAVFFRETIYGHSGLNDLFKFVQAVRKPLARVCQGFFDLKSLLPDRRDGYLTYKGSLTTPNCNEVVTWILLEHPRGISKKQLANFFKVDIGSRYNYRRLQPLNGRTIYAARPLSNIWPSSNSISNNYYKYNSFVSY